MSDASATIPETMASTSAKTAAQKATETAIDRILNGVMDAVSSKFGQAKAYLGTGFHTYLANAYKRYNQVRTLATGLEPQSIVGPNNIYVHIGVSYHGKEIDTHTVEPMLNIGNNLLIFGTGGIGKSMLMRYLFLNTIDRGSHIPVLLELRKVSEQDGANISIPELVYTCMGDFNAKLPMEQFEYSLELGKYLFLFDGLDEVPESKVKQTAAAIQVFSAKYPKNAYIITSRPSRDPSPLETFIPLDSMMMNKKQAVSLARKLGNASANEKVAAFCQQLEEELYDKHKDFAENPLLLSMMFLTFMYNSSIPDHLTEFYEKSYEALYSAHDSRDKGMFQREFQCKDLDEQSFKRLFSHFCFHTFIKQKYEFNENEILSWINKGIKKLNLSPLSAKDYLTDLRNAVCLIVKDGNTYRFAHRSFQTYFAALYTRSLPDNQQKVVFSSTLKESYYANKDYFCLLFQLEPDRSAENMIEPCVRKLQQEAAQSDDAATFILKNLYSEFGIRTLHTKTTSKLEKNITLTINDAHPEVDNAINLFRLRFKPIQRHKKIDQFYWLVQQIENIYKDYTDKDSLISFDSFDQSAVLTEQERSIFYQRFTDWMGIPEIYQDITQWLSELDAKRAALSTPNFIDDL